jgi:hypothetical protein
MGNAIFVTFPLISLPVITKHSHAYTHIHTHIYRFVEKGMLVETPVEERERWKRWNETQMKVKEGEEVVVWDPVCAA